ncbi:MAG: ACP S-malonyltransferase [Alphaproteobacteria bacterium]
MTTALLFPGQGSQALGMGKSLAENFAAAREVFAEIDEALSQKLYALMQDGPEADLNRTENTQPAIMAVSLAAYKVLEKETGLSLPSGAAYVAGHSLGEYSALTATGALSLSDCAKLLRIRGRAMQEAVPEGQGGMVAVIGPELAGVEAIVAEARARAAGEIIEIANHNSTNQIVLSGSARGMELAIEVAKEKGAKRAMPLTVSAPFHCSLMLPAAEKMREALAAARVLQPKVPVIANVTAEPVSDPTKIRELLVEQVTGMVRWVDSVKTLERLGVTRMIEIGHGNVLSGLIKRISPEMSLANVSSVEDIAAVTRAA